MHGSFIVTVHFKLQGFLKSREDKSLKIYGRTIKGTKILREVSVEKSNENISFTDILEECLIGVCKELDISVPLWLKKNTSEFVRYHKTSFAGEQFVETVAFDRFEIRLT
jgi:hypothetical protein